MRLHLALVLALFGISASPFGQKAAWEPPPGHITLPLWPQTQQSSLGPETDITTAKDDLVADKRVMRLTNVAAPTITLYAPKGKNNGTTVVVFPGGAYHILALDLEGTEVCDWLVSIEVHCVLLKYRVPDSGPYPKYATALQDAQRALGIVREHAAEWHIDPHRVGVLGFSAGGHLAAALSTHFEQRIYDAVDAADKLECRPDFTALIYPAYLTLEDQNFAPDPEIHVTDKTPPAFMVQAEDDGVHVENSTAYFLALKNAKVPAEMHLYAEGGHGYGLRRTKLPVTDWPASVETWLHTIKMLPAKP